MYLTPRAFAQQLVDNMPTQRVVDLLWWIQIALHRLGSRFVSRASKDNNDQDEIHTFARFLHRHGKLSVKHVKTLLSLVKVLKSDYAKEFRIRGTSSQEVGGLLESRFGSVDVQETTKDAVAVEIRGEGWIYKRSLDGDLEKLLHENN